MKRITCEMCGSNDVMKTEGLYVCQNCGTKYSVEEARKLMIEGVVDVSGSTVKIDSSEDLSNYYTLARRARSENNLDNQFKYYEMILQKDPNSWEAYLYYGISKMFTKAHPDLSTVQSSAKTLYGLIHDTINDKQKQIAAIKEASEVCIGKTHSYYYNWKNTYIYYIEEFRGETQRDYQISFARIVDSSVETLCCIGDTMESLFPDMKEINPLCISAWKDAIDIMANALPYLKSKERDTEDDKQFVSKYAAKVQRYEPTYQSPLAQKKRSGSLFGKLFG